MCYCNTCYTTGHITLPLSLLPLILARLQCILLTNLVVAVFKYSYSGYIIVSLSLIWWKWDNGTMGVALEITMGWSL